MIHRNLIPVLKRYKIAAEPIKSTPWDDEHDLWCHDEIEKAEAACYAEWMVAYPFFMLNMSRLTGKRCSAHMIHRVYSEFEQKKIFYFGKGNKWFSFYVQHLEINP